MTHYSFRELSSQKDYDQCIGLQKSVFGLSDVEIVSPLLLQLFKRNNPPVGIAMGMFENQTQEKLIGFIIGMSTFSKSEIYIPLVGMKKTHQNKGLGILLMNKFKEMVSERGAHRLSCIIDPLDSKLASFYISKLGFRGSQFIENAYSQSNQDNISTTENDSLLIHWNLKENEDSSFESQDLTELPKLSPDHMPDSKITLLEIPSDLGEQSNLNTSLSRHSQYFRLLKEYLNNRNYIITNCLADNAEGKMKTYYLLEKR
jgi:predicted GNAT superfamily acetyltransferase